MSGSGQVTGVGVGEVTVSAEYQGLRGSTRVRVQGPFTGRFTGTISAVCALVGPTAIAFGCSHWLAIGAPLQTMALDLTQSNDLRSVTGTVSFGASRLAIGAGSVDAEGRLRLSATGSPGAGVTWDFRDFVGTLSGSALSADFVVLEDRWGGSGSTIIVGGRLTSAPRQ